MTAPEILYADESIVVINKPAGMLSVPGRAPNRQDSVVKFIRNVFPQCIAQPSVHRLDMDTSGLMVFALTTEAHKNLSIQFQTKAVNKRYIAILDGLIGGSQHKKAEHLSCGRIKLEYRLNPENRPYQIYDPVNGKSGTTIWKKLGVFRGKTRVEFKPLTGRTHQLRLHAAHQLKLVNGVNTGGLGCPIAGDRLYGNSSDIEHEEGKRMLLHAYRLCFTHPETGKKIRIESKPCF